MNLSYLRSSVFTRKFIVIAQAARQDPDAQQGGGGGHHNQDTPEMKAVKKFHLEKNGWIDVLAWSHGNSTKNMQDLSLTKYSDQYTPIFTGTHPHVLHWMELHAEKKNAGLRSADLF